MIATALLLCGTLARSPVQEAAPRTIRIGERVEGVLPVRLEGNRNVAEVSFELDTGGQPAATLKLQSLDFDALLAVRDPSTGVEERDGASWRHSNGWLVLEGLGGTKLTVRILAEDDRGGEFVLETQAGRTEPPRGGESLQEVVLYCEAVAARAQERGEGPREAQFLGIGSRAAFRAGNYPRARILAERQLERARTAELPGEVLRASVNLGGAEKMVGDRERARSLLLDALVRIEAALAEEPESSPLVRQLAAMAAFASDNLGEIARETRGFAAALPFVRQSLEWTRRAQRRDFEPLLWCRLGEALGEVGQVREAQAAIEKGLTLADSLGRPELLASALLSHSRFELKMGFAIDARAGCERALSLSAPPGIGLELEATFAEACIDLGDLEEAVVALDSVDSRAQELGARGYEIPILLSRARIAYDVWDLPRARVLLEEALGKQEASGSRVLRSEVLKMLGRVALDQGRVDEARESYRKAVETCRATGNPEAQARILVDLAMLQDGIGDLDDALRTSEEAEELACEADSDYAGVLARNERGYVLHLQGRHLEARRLASDVVSDRENAGDLRVALEAHDTLARVGLALGELDAAEDSLRAAEVILERRSPPSDRFSAAGRRSRYAKLGGIAQEIVARRVESSKDSDGTREALLREGWLAAGEWKGRVLLEHLRENGRDGAHPASPRPEPHVAILDFVDGIDKLYAYLVAGDAIRIFDLGERKPVEDRVRRLVQALAEPVTSPGAYAADAGWIYDRLLAPLAAHFPAGTKTLVLVPSAALAVLPFEALVVPSPDRKTDDYSELRYVIDDFGVAYAPSAPVLSELELRASKVRDRRFLILGDPVYQPEDQETREPSAKLATARIGGSEFDQRRLKSTKEESLEIARLLLLGDPSATDGQRTGLLRAGSERSLSLRTATFDLYLGAEASREQMRNDLEDFTVLHIAAHGQIDPDDPRRSGLLLSFEPEKMGLLTLEDVGGLHLDADLAVLSACDTAGGPILQGEGVQSLAYAFLQAGARSVVASLWEIEDDAASRIMRSFYADYLERAAHPVEALRRAKLEFRRSKLPRGVPPGSTPQASATPDNPYYWAPFVYVGAAGD